jgi:4-hydroxy 2-oxovalerate aldolase
MVVPTVCPISAMADLDRPDIDLIRIASYPWDVDRAHAYVDAAHELGARASVNLMALSYVDEQELGAIARSFVRTGPDIFYVADSFGALTTVEIAKRISILRAELPCDIGIHAHNNLGLAAANALAGLDAGAAWLDASLCSMARGAGNLATEQAAAILASHPDYTSNVDIPAILACARYVAEEVLPEPMKTGPDEIAAGLHNHHYYYLPLVAAASAEHGLDPYEVGHRLGLTMPHTVKHELVGEICKSLKLERGQ